MQKQHMQVVSWVPLVSGDVFMLFIVCWETGLLGERVGEAVCAWTTKHWRK